MPQALNIVEHAVITVITVLQERQMWLINNVPTRHAARSQTELAGLVGSGNSFLDETPSIDT